MKNAITDSAADVALRHLLDDVCKIDPLKLFISRSTSSRKPKIICKMCINEEGGRIEMRDIIS